MKKSNKTEAVAAVRSSAWLASLPGYRLGYEVLLKDLNLENLEFALNHPEIARGLVETLKKYQDPETGKLRTMNDGGQFVRTAAYYEAIQKQE